VVIVYDIAIERIDKVRQYLRQYLTWIQNSAFEGELTRGQLERIKTKLGKLINRDEDSIIIFTASSKKWVGREVLGVEKAEVSTIV
jgi:CRISPR-associated protein Cas2